MWLIKNTTPYIGKIKLKFEKYPHYQGSSVLNSVILNLGFTKLVSRMYPNKSLDGWQVDKEKVAKICMYTGGTIKKHEWWEVKGINGVFKSNRAPKNKKDIVFHGVLDNSFMYGDTYLGNIKEAWWYYKNRLVVCEKYPRGVAMKLKKNSWHNTDLFNDCIEGIYGFSHRCGCLFRIGDRLFDANYHPHVKDYTPEQWKVWHDKYRKRLKGADEFDTKWLTEDGVAGFIPFNQRGKKVIEIWEDAMEAAKNLSNYLS